MKPTTTADFVRVLVQLFGLGYERDAMLCQNHYSKNVKLVAKVADFFQQPCICI
jgi:hypothetical protein